MSRFYILDKTTREMYKRNLTRKQMRFWKRFGKKLGYRILVLKHKQVGA